MNLQRILDWFAGDGRYRTLFHCMDQDILWITITVVLDIAVATGYAMIAIHWWRQERVLPDIPAKRALTSIRNIFIFCGICGYLFIPVKMYWPAWRLYDFFMVFLAYSTWKYALHTRGLSVVYKEIGRSNELAADLERSREESRRKSFFLNAISHDLRTPLNAMILQSHLADISLTTKNDEQLAGALHDIRANAKVTSDLLNTLLEYARLDWSDGEPVHTETINLAELVREVLHRHQTTADARGLYLRSNVPDDLKVHLDVSKLDRVLTNLLGNAMKFTKTGGVRVDIDTAGDNLELHVIDTGVGIDSKSQETLFAEFMQLDNAERDRSKGFGIGLAISRRLARSWGGDVLVQSSPGAGSRFTVLLPGVLGNKAANALVAVTPDGQTPAVPVEMTKAD